MRDNSLREVGTVRLRIEKAHNLLSGTPGALFVAGVAPGAVRHRATIQHFLNSPAQNTFGLIKKHLP
jgi:hypothetical protein